MKPIAVGVAHLNAGGERRRPDWSVDAADTGGLTELLGSVAARGYHLKEAALAEVVLTDDPIADLTASAFSVRRFAREHPALYRLMYGADGTSTFHAADGHGVAQLDAGAFAHLLRIAERAEATGRMRRMIAADAARSLWIQLHG